MISYDDLLYGPAHAILGVDAVLTPNATIGPVELVVIDKTSGVPVEGDSVGTDLQTIRPAAVVRRALLTDVPLSELEGGIIVFNSKTWRIESYGLRPSPGGEADGEVWLFLIAGE